MIIIIINLIFTAMEAQYSIQFSIRSGEALPPFILPSTPFSCFSPYLSLYASLSFLLCLFFMRHPFHSIHVSPSLYTSLFIFLSFFHPPYFSLSLSLFFFLFLSLSFSHLCETSYHIVCNANVLRCYHIAN